MTSSEAGGQMRRISSIGAAVVGSGFIGTVHVQALRRLGVTVHGLLGSAPERAAARAADLGVPRAYDSLDDLLDDANVEVVHVASPNDLHHEQVRRALVAGRHVVCEKPLTMTAAESEELVRVVSSSGRVGAVCFNQRHYPLNQHLASAVRGGELGTIRLATGRYFQDWLALETDWNWRLEPQRGGVLRAVGDIGSHWFDLVEFVTGLRIVEVMADLATFIPVRRQPAGPVETFSRERSGDTVARGVETEDAATILLRFEGGARGALAISQVSPGRKNSLRYEISGSKASAAWDAEQPERLWIGRRERPGEIMLSDPALMAAAGRAAASLPAGHVEGFADTFVALFRAVYAEVAAGGPSAQPAYPTFADGHDANLVIEAVGDSTRTGGWATVARAG